MAIRTTGFHRKLKVSMRWSNITVLKKVFCFEHGTCFLQQTLLYAAVGVPGSTHDSRLLKVTRLYQQLSEGEIFPNKCLHLGHSGEILLVTIGGSALPQHSWLLTV